MFSPLKIISRLFFKHLAKFTIGQVTYFPRTYGIYTIVRRHMVSLLFPLGVKVSFCHLFNKTKLGM